MENRNSEKGSLLITSIMVIVVVGAAAAVLTHMSARSSIDSVEASQATKAMYMAETGLEVAKYELKAAQCIVADMNLPLDDSDSNGSFSVSIADIGNDQFQFDAVGSGTKSGQRTLREVVTCAPVSVWSAGLISCENLTVNGNANFNSYNSTTGATELGNGNVQTTNADATVTLSGNANIRGNLANTGANGGVSLAGNAKIYGEAYSTGTINTSSNGWVELPLPLQSATTSSSDCDPLGAAAVVSNNQPAGSPIGFSLSGNGTLTRTIDEWNASENGGHFSSFSIGANRILQLDGPGDFVIYVANSGSFSIAGNGQLQLLNGAKLTIYLTGTMALAGNGISNSSVPADLQIYSGSANSFQVTGNGGLVATIYAPLSAVTIAGNGTIDGGVRGRTVTNSGNGAFTYDEALASLELEVGTIVIGPTISWEEIY